MIRIQRALLSCYDKTDLERVARALHDRGVEILSSGGTAAFLSEAGLPVTTVEAVTGHPELFSGRVKTLHPAIHAGILARRNHEGDMTDLADRGYEPIDCVIVNLYPFEAARAEGREGAELWEMIDVGGPTLLRSAAKNHEAVLAIPGPESYDELLRALEEGDDDGDGGAVVGEPLARRFAARTFRTLHAYDEAIAETLEATVGPTTDDRLPDVLRLRAPQKLSLRYGENPHQRAALYAAPDEPSGFAAFTQHHGKGLSYNNLLDADAAYRLALDLPEPGAVVCKHGNPCGAATGDTLSEAFAAAHASDPMSAYGSILASNLPIDEATARAIAEAFGFVELLIAPAISEPARNLLTTKPKWRKNVRLLECPPPEGRGLEIRSIGGALLLQDTDRGPFQSRTVTERKPDGRELADARFLWTVCKHVRSNAIVVGREGRTTGIGAGQMSRVDAVKIALDKAGDRTRGAVLASDGFFPFADGVEAAVEKGITTIIQPGGSKRDPEVIEAADKHNIAMILTDIRHFRH